MSTIEKAIQKQRKLSNEIEQTFNTTESHSNSSFFDEEHSQTFSESDCSEEFQDSWEMSSICTDNSSNPNFHPEEMRSQHSQPNPNQCAVRGAGIGKDFEVTLKGDSNLSKTGKGIATHVHGQGSIGTSSKKSKKLQKSITKQLSQQQQENNNNSSSSQSSSSHIKQISQSSKIMLAYLMMESEIEKSAEQRANSFIEKFVPNGSWAKQMITETYKIILIPESILQQLSKVLSAQQKLLHLNLALQRLSLSNNKHPLAAKAADKLRKYLGVDY